MKKYKLTLTPELCIALISAIDVKLNENGTSHTDKLIMAGLMEVKEKLVSKSFLQQGEFKVGLTHVQSLSLLCLFLGTGTIPIESQLGNFLLLTSNEIAQKYSV